MWKKAAGAVVVVVLMAAGVYLVTILTHLPQKLPQIEERQSLEENWDSTIRRFGIEPVFPPEEDLTVGDVLAVVVADNEDDPVFEAKKVDKRSPFLKRSVKLAHVDVRKELSEAYTMLPVFTTPASSSTAVKQSPDPAGTPSTRSVGRLFMQEVLQGDLPRAAFPSLKIQGVNTAGAGLSAGTQGAATYAASTQGLEEFHLTEVRTYGLPTVRALELLVAYCDAENTKSECKEATARKHLERIIGDRIYSKYVYDTQGKTKYAITVELVMVSRVYLTRSILHVRRADSTRGGGARVIFVPVQRDGVTAASETREQTPPNPQGVGGNRAEYKAMKKRLDEVEKQLAAARGGGGLSYESSAGNEIQMKEDFDRPVAIGYRNVRYEFIEDNNQK